MFGDDRGFFMETWHERAFADQGIPATFVQDNLSRSAAGTLRGLHYQLHQPQGKLARVTAGEVYDVVVDLRRSSPTFGQWAGLTLSAENKVGLWVPPGFAHGFYVTRGPADFQYKCTDYYAPEHERTLRWDDSALGITWPIAEGSAPTVSAKDAVGLPLGEVECYP